MKIDLKLPLVAFLLTIGATSVFGWGENGHRISAELAERNLTPEAKAAIREILGDETLAEISIWPDHIRSDPSWDFAQPWHYISIDDDETWDDYKRVPEEEGDVLLILEKLEAFLRDPDAEKMEFSGNMKRKGTKLNPTQGREIGKKEALAFYVHFVGDIHQPLHVGRRDDKGGNKIQVKWFDEEASLHRVWDELVVESAHLSYTEFTTFLNRVSDKDRIKWQADPVLEWAKESRAVRDEVYNFGAQRKGYFINIVEAPSLSYDYRAKALPIARERLTKAGIRLAGKLNSIFVK